MYYFEAQPLQRTSSFFKHCFDITRKRNSTYLMVPHRTLIGSNSAILFNIDVYLDNILLSINGLLEILGHKRHGNFNPV